MDLYIRRAREEEIPLLAEMDRAVFSPPDALSEEDFCDPDFENFIILLDSTAIGSTILAPNRGITKRYDDPLPVEEGVVYIISTALIPEFQEQGIGSIVKAWQIAYARRNGFKKIITNVRKSNLASLALNMKFGLRVTQLIPEYYNPEGDSEFREGTFVLQLKVV
jgi:ribosomal protein S18 acetylase RimI-like enzyme